MLWHVSAYWSSGTGGPLRDQVVRSVEVLLRHYADEPRIAWRVWFKRNGMPSRLDDRLLPGLVAGARRREAKGLALLALAEYVEEKAGYVVRVQEDPPPFTLGRPGGPQSRPFDDAYEKEFRALDAAPLRREAQALFTRVASEFGDVRNPADPEYPLWTMPSHLGDEAAKHLRALRSIPLGAAPDVSWRDRDGGTTRLADFRGKVVVLAFWRDGDPSCRREFAHDAELARKWAGRPFVLVGFTQPVPKLPDSPTRYSLPFRRPDGREAVAEDGPIRERFGVWRYPTTVVLDADGVVRFQCGESVLLGGYIDGLVREAEAKAAKR
jgi:peroxiredoxin